MREISCGGEGARDRTLAILEQRIQIIHERLHFARIVPFDSLAASVANPKTDRREGSETAQPLFG